MAAEVETKIEQPDLPTSDIIRDFSSDSASISSKPKGRAVDKSSPGAAKRRCVSTACIACRKRKSKCDGNTPSCAACSSVYNTECIYDPNSDHRRKGVYKKDIDNLKTRNSTLQTLIQAILNYPEDEVPDLVKQIRTCESLDDVAESILARKKSLDEEDDDDGLSILDNGATIGQPQFERELSGKMGKLRLDNGSLSIIGGTSNLIFLDDDDEDAHSADNMEDYDSEEEPVTSWTEVTSDARLILHLMNMYFTWHYTYFTTLSKTLFWRDFKQGRPAQDTKRKTAYCTPLLVNAMLALGCHFSSWPSARADEDDSATAGDHFFREAKRLIWENDEHEKPRLATVQALALMSVREAGCGREARGWVYSGMSFRMAYDLGLNIESGTGELDENEIDARRMTIWGCFLFDKCWSNYLGRQPQLPLSSIAVPKFDVFPLEDADIWKPYMDSGTGQAHAQPSRTRAVALQISLLCEISSDLLLYFYHPHQLAKPLGKQAELKKLSELHTRLEAWKKNLPKEFEPKEGQLPNVLVMHMFFQLLYIHLFRPFLKYKPATSPLPSHVSPRKFLIHAATAISKLLRLYRRTYGLRQICNIVVYITHSACTIHLLNLPDKFAARDIVHGLNHLEEIAESWICARRTLGILYQVARRWKIEVPEQAQKTFERADMKFGSPSTPQGHDAGLSPTFDTPMIPPAPQMKYTPQMNLNDVSQPFQQDLTVSNGNYLPRTASVMSPIESPLLPLDGPHSLPPQQVGNLSHKGWQHQQQQQMVPPPPVMQQQANIHTQDLWTAPNARPQSNGLLTSPTMLFGGVDGLIKDQEWWLQDSNQIFANWNGYDGRDGDGLGNVSGYDSVSPSLGNGVGGRTHGNGTGAYDYRQL